MNTEAKALKTEVEPSPVHAVAKAPLKARRAFFVLGALIAAVLLAIGGYALFTRGEESTDDAQVDADVVPLSAHVSGDVAKVLVEDNAHVKAGQTIVELDPADLEAKLAQARAELATAQAQADTARAQKDVVASTAKGGYDSARALVSGSGVGVASANAQVAAAEAGLARAKADARRTSANLARIRKLADAGAVAQQQVDDAQSADDVAQAALAQAKANLTAARDARRAASDKVAEAQGHMAQSGSVDAQVTAADAAVKLADARVQAAQAAVTLAEHQLAYTKIVAPFDGYVSKLSVHGGQLVSPGQPIAELVPENTYVVANFKETQMSAIHVGDHAKVKVDAFGGRELDAMVESISAGTGARFALLPADNASGNFVKVVQRVPVRLKWVGKPDLLLRAGLSVDVTVYDGTAPAQSTATARR